MEGSDSRTDESARDNQPAEQSGGWAFPALLLVLLAGVAIFAFSQKPSSTEPNDSEQPTAWTPSPPPTAETVRLTIDFGNGAKRQFDTLHWTPKMTVADVLEAARTFRPGIRFSQQGTGASGFLTSLEGVGNEGAQGRNWRFLVDGRLGEISFCLAKVEPGASVLWEYSAEY